MSQYAVLKAAIAAVIKQNGSNEITGDLLQQQLLAMVNSLGAEYQFMGVATPATNPGTPDQRIFYLAIEPGTYTNFGGVTVAGLSVLKWDAQWSVELVARVMFTRDWLLSCDLNDIKDNGMYMLADSYTYQNIPANFSSGFLRVSRYTTTSTTALLQEFISFSGNWLLKRRCFNNIWEEWQQINIGPDAMIMRGALGPTDLNNVVTNGTWLLADNFTYQNVPDNATTGFLRVSLVESGRWVLQEYLSFSGAKYYKRRGSIVNGTWETWQLINGTVNNITNEYDFNSYSQSVTLNATPSITTDTNNYLASTGDNTDRTADILAMLQATGVCHLGPGPFYIKNLQMPNSTSIIGSGMATHIYMLDGDGFAIKMGSRCEIKDFRLFGTTSTYTPGSTVGNRHGILWQGNYTQSQSAPISSIVSDIYINGFNGGGITCYDTGYGTHNFLACVNVLIEDCDAGINISYWSEFHKFTNCRTRSCYYGCINNGGNNVFVNCDFSSCYGKAFVMDNSQGQSPNNSHGSCVACVFNHTANNAGIGIEILDCDSGFIFSGCQIFFSQINIVDSDGVVFQGCNFGYNNCNISIDGGGAILFANNMHQAKAPITITNNQNVHFVNCYNRSTGATIEP